ncbi:MAG TPA: PRC-barrel domain-containing protein [Egibacteraceae bacterium]|nr:PRC-barrel domain-containing protein [Egibacteraceae bacterium]
MSDLWTYRSPPGEVSLVGFSVDARDGKIGKIDDATYDVESSYIVVDTGPWIFGRKVLLPAGVIEEIDLDNERVMVARTKDEIREAPEFDSETGFDRSRRDEWDSYYGGF